MSSAIINISIYYLPISVGAILRLCLQTPIVSLLQKCILKKETLKYEWIGIGIISFSGVISAIGTILNESYNNNPNSHVTMIDICIGTVCILMFCFVYAIQMLIEEKLMKNNDEDHNIHPLLVVGWEGIWGMILSVVIDCFILYYIPGGSNHGRFENYKDAVSQIWNSSELQNIIFLFIISSLAYNVLSVLTIFYADSVTCSISDTFKPLVSWMISLSLYYFFNNYTSGEEWNMYSYFQLISLFLIFYGITLYTNKIFFFNKCVLQRYKINEDDMDVGLHKVSIVNNNQENAILSPVIYLDHNYVSPNVENIIYPDK